MSADRPEDQLIAWLRNRQESRGLSSPIGDDAALLDNPGDLAVTVDTQVEGVHFLPGTDPRTLAHRLLAVNLSDLAAVGARPAWGFLVISGPETFETRHFFDAFLDASAEVGLTLAGGDVGHQSNLTLALTALGNRRDPGRWLRRSEARTGQRLWLGGTVGEAALGLRLVERGARVEWQEGGPTVRLPKELDLAKTAEADLADVARRAVLRHQLPTAQLELGAWLSGVSTGGAIDVSDGLALDLHRLAEASGVGIRLESEALPTSRGSRALCRHLELDPLELSLTGGEDYVLLFTLPNDIAPPPHFGARAIGRVDTGSGPRIVDAEGEHPLPAMGWDHLREARNTERLGDDRR